MRVAEQRLDGIAFTDQQQRRAVRKRGIEIGQRAAVHRCKGIFFRPEMPKRRRRSPLPAQRSDADGGAADDQRHAVAVTRGAQPQPHELARALREGAMPPQRHARTKIHGARERQPRLLQHDARLEFAGSRRGGPIDPPVIVAFGVAAQLRELETITAQQGRTLTDGTPHAQPQQPTAQVFGEHALRSHRLSWPEREPDVDVVREELRRLHGPGRGFDRIELDLFGAVVHSAELLQLPRRGNHHAFGGADCPIIRIDGASQRAAQAREMLAERGKALVEIGAQLADLTRVLRQLLLTPTEGDGAQQRDERRGRREDDVLRHARFDQPRVLLERRAVEMLAGKEHHHEVRSLVELLPIRLASQRIDMRADVARELYHLRAAHLLVGALDRVKKGLRGRLGVDDDGAVVRELDDHVRTEPAARLAIVRLDRLLSDEVDVLPHAGHLDDALQLHLSPAPADGRIAQRLAQARRLRTQRRRLLHEPLLGLEQTGDLLGHAFVGTGPRLLQLDDLGVDLVERLADGLDKLADGLLALLQLTFGHLVHLGQRLVRELQEALVVLLQRVSAERGERLGDFLLQPFDGGSLLLERFALGIETAAQGGELLGRGGMLRAELRKLLLAPLREALDDHEPTTGDDPRENRAGEECGQRDEQRSELHYSCMLNQERNSSWGSGPDNQYP